MQASLLVAPGAAFKNEVDLSHNMLTGAVPGFLASNAVPSLLTIALVVSGMTCSSGCGCQCCFLTFLQMHHFVFKEKSCLWRKVLDCAYAR